jgi:uncharacterized membrane protein
MESEALIVAGTGSQISTSNRWGDYTSMVIDAADDCTFWYTAEYYMVTARFDWSTRLASFKFPSCGSTTPDFSISASPNSLTISQGASKNSTVTITALNGYAGTVNLSASGLPSGATASFTPASVTGSGTSSMGVTVGASTTPGTYTITVTGTDSVTSTLAHSTQVTLVVPAPPDFTISRSPTSQTVTQGSPASYTATITAQNGFSGIVTFSASGLPANATASFNPTTVTGSGSSTLTVTTNNTTATGTFTVTITGTSGTLVHSTTVSLTVNPAPVGDFSIGALPSSATVSRGGSTTYSATVTPSGGFTGSVVFSVTGLPARTSATFSPASVSGTGSSTLTVKTNKPTTRGTYTLTITGTSSSLVHSANVTLIIQ